MLVTMIDRMGAARRAIAQTWGQHLSPALTGLALSGLRLHVILAQSLDSLFFPKLKTTRIERPIILVGNPRTGTTFLQRFLDDNGVGAGQQLWRMLYASLTLQALVRPFLPILEKFSPARHHSTAAHKTSLTGVETDDVSVFFRYFDGFFLYGFLLAWAEDDLLPHFDPGNRNTNARDFDYLEQLWRRNLVATGRDRVVAKLFSLGPRTPEFLERFPDARILYMARDPLSVIPSGMSLITGVLDKRFGFWSLPEAVRARYLDRLYGAFVMLLQRFTEDWNAGRIPRESVKVVRFDRLMADFDVLMDEILEFVGHEPDEALRQVIAAKAETQRAYTSGHGYDLERFGLTEDRIRQDCAFFYETFLSD
jgi:hypothetical protein